jgi:aminopeptidase 2
MGATEDSALLDETTKFITNKARDQDITYFFGALEGNFKARRKLTKYLQDEYDVVSSTMVCMQTRGF